MAIHYPYSATYTYVTDATSISRSVAFPNDPEFAHSNPDFTGLPASITLNLNGSYTLAQDAANSNNSYATLKADVYAQIAQHLSGNSNLQPAHIEQVQFWVWRSFRDHFNQIFGSGANYDLFSLRLIYNEGMESIDPNSQGQYNGNISGMLWENPTSCTKKGYVYQYDGLNRLTQATYGEKATTQSNWSQHAGRYNASYNYDLNGNILTLTRQGKITNGYGSMDILTYTYSGNQLTSVNDAGDNSFQTMHQFLDGNTSGTDYQYDGSGNMIDDMNKGIDILYNHLNKPTSIQKGIQIIQYIYSADGIKLRQKVTTSEPLPGQPAVSKITDYVNGYEYEDPDGGGNASSKELVHIMHAKGRMVYDATNDSYTYEYFLKDHLGNTRVVFADNNQDGRINPDPLNGTDIRQIVEGYYPFGAQHNTDQRVVISPENQYLYNGKEKQDELNLGWYDYGARMYDVTIARWNGVDALAEKYLAFAPYNYVANNPIIFIDPDGREGVISIEGNTITISAVIYIYGEGASFEMANSMENRLMKMWNQDKNGNSWTYTSESGNSYSVKFDISVKLFIPMSPIAFGTKGPTLLQQKFSKRGENFIEMSPNIEESRVNRGGYSGVWRSYGRDGLNFEDDDPSVHELGHLLGLTEKYGYSSGLGKRTETPKRDRENVMSRWRSGGMNTQHVSQGAVNFIIDGKDRNIFGYRAITREGKSRKNHIEAYESSEEKSYKARIRAGNRPTPKYDDRWK